MEFVRQQRNSGQLLVADFDARWIFVGVQLCAYFQSLIGLGVGNQIDYHLMAPEWLAAPVLADKGEEPMLDLVPFAGARRKVAHRDLETGFVGELLYLHFPQTESCSVTTTRVRRNQQLTGFGISFPTHPAPPTADALDREGCRIMINANAHPAFVAGLVVERHKDSIDRRQNHGLQLPPDRPS